MSEQQNCEPTRERYEQEIAAREQRIEKIAEELAELEDKLEEARAEAIVGAGSQAQVAELRSQIESRMKLGQETRGEIDALKRALARIDEPIKAANREKALNERVIPAALAIADEAHRAESAARELGEAMAAMLRASRDADNACPFADPSHPIRQIDPSTLAAHLWAVVCASGDLPPVMRTATLGAHEARTYLHQVGRDVFRGPIPADQPMAARRFAATWHGLLNNAGRQEAAAMLLNRIVGSEKAPPQRRRA